MSNAIPETLPEYDRTRVTERPNGYFWQALDGGREYGPFATLLEAVLDMQAVDAQPPEPGESVEEAKSEIGISGWIDSETGDPAEEERPRLEQH